MTCPLEQMAEEHRVDANIFDCCVGVWSTVKLGRGERMWYIATVGMSYNEAVIALGEEWVKYLEEKYP